MEKLEEIAITSVIIPFIKDIVVPKITRAFKDFKKRTVSDKELEDSFTTYLSQRYEKFFLIETLAFPNKQTLFKLLYEPLTIFDKTERKPVVEFKIDKFPENLFSKHYRIIIEDTAGMGKSTITQKLFLSIVEEKVGIPLLIELRKINNKNSIIKEIQNQLTPIGDLINEELIFKLIKDGDFIFLFDGFDEISIADKEFAISDLHNFKEKANNNYFLITSRAEDSLNSFKDFQKFNIKELSIQESYSLIRRYDYYSFKPISQELIRRLTANEEKSLEEYLKNPLLVSLLFKSFEYKKELPIKKSQFYGQVYDALFETHDLSKEGYFKREKFSNLHIDDFERVLRYIAYFTSIKNKVEYDKNFILNVIDDVRKYLPDLNFKSSDFLNDLLNTVPVFKKDGNFFKWSHKSLQDYFSAKFIWIDAKENQLAIIRKIYNDEDNRRFLNILDIFYELDIKTFELTILTWILEDFKEYVKKNYQEIPNVSRKKIIQRLEKNYNRDFTIVVTKEEYYDDISSGKHVKGNFNFFQYYRKKVKHEFESTYYHYFSEPPVVVLLYSGEQKTSKSTILELVNNRQPNLTKIDNNMNHFGRLELLKVDNAYVVDDKSDNLLNNPLIFSTVTDLMIGSSTFFYEHALAKLKELENNNLDGFNNKLTDW